MMGWSLVGFIIGVLLVQHGHFSPQLWRPFLGVMGLGLWCFFFVLWRLSPKRFGVLYFLAGVSWGTGHSGLTGPPPREEGRVVAVAAQTLGSGPLLVEVRGTLWEAYGKSQIGAVGSLKKGAGFSALRGYRLTLVSRNHFEVGHPASWWMGIQTEVQSWIKGRIRTLGRPSDQLWVSAVLLGDVSGSFAAIKESFRKTGLLHLLAVSGLHVTLMAHLMAGLLRFPFILLYVSGVLSAFFWRGLSAWLRLVTGAVALIYLSLTGASAAAQRAALLFTLIQIMAIFWGDSPRKERYMCVAFLQMLLFPVGFVSEGTLMSWGAYLLVVERSHPNRAAWISALALQGRLSVMATAVFGQWAALGLLANLWLVPVFSMLLGFAFVALICPISLVREWILEMSRIFIDLINYFAGLCERWPWLYWVGKDGPASGTLGTSGMALPFGLWLVSLVGSIIFFLNACKNLSIRRLGGRDDG